jgi:hypothetical protein
MKKWFVPLIILGILAFTFGAVSILGHDAYDIGEAAGVTAAEDGDIVAGVPNEARRCERPFWGGYWISASWWERYVSHYYQRTTRVGNIEWRRAVITVEHSWMTLYPRHQHVIYCPWERMY